MRPRTALGAGRVLLNLGGARCKVAGAENPSAHQVGRHPVRIVAEAQDDFWRGRIGEVGVPVGKGPVVNLNRQPGVLRVLVRMHEVRARVAELRVDRAEFFEGRSDFEDVKQQAAIRAAEPLRNHQVGLTSAGDVHPHLDHRGIGIVLVHRADEKFLALVFGLLLVDGFVVFQNFEVGVAAIFRLRVEVNARDVRRDRLFLMRRHFDRGIGESRCRESCEQREDQNGGHGGRPTGTEAMARTMRSRVLRKSDTSKTGEAEALRGRRRRGRRLDLRDDGRGSFVAAFLVGALPGDTGALQVFLDHVVRAA